LEIVNVAMPRVTARPNAPFDLPVSVSVRNAGDASTRFSLTAEFPSRLDGSSAGPFELGPRETKRTPFRIHTRIGNLRFQGDELPIVIRLVGPSGRELDRHRTRVPFLSEPEVTEREISEAIREQKNKTVEQVGRMMMHSFTTRQKVMSAAGYSGGSSDNDGEPACNAEYTQCTSTCTHQGGGPLGSTHVAQCQQICQRALAECRAREPGGAGGTVYQQPAPAGRPGAVAGSSCGGACDSNYTGCNSECDRRWSGPFRIFRRARCRRACDESQGACRTGCEAGRPPSPGGS
jgi:hypothetical protein